MVLAGVIPLTADKIGKGPCHRHRAVLSAMSISVISFGFKYGIPIEADLVFDVRFLPNPFYIPELKTRSFAVERLVVSMM